MSQISQEKKITAVCPQEFAEVTNEAGTQMKVLLSYDSLANSGMLDFDKVDDTFEGVTEKSDFNFE